MKEEQFILKNKEKWETLENYNKRVVKYGISSLNKDEIKNFTNLFKDLSHQLSFARTHFPQSNITIFLNQIIGQSHNFLFVSEKASAISIKSYFTKGFRLHVSKYNKYFLTSMGLLVAGFLFCFILVMINEAWGSYFFPGFSIEYSNLNPEITGDGWHSTLMASFITTNNIQVSFFAFALGITAGIGTAFILFYNGMIVGALFGVIVRASSGNLFANIIMFISLIFPHGFIELAAIFISGAAGLIIGKNILMPEIHSRKHAFVKGAKEGAYFIPGIVVMLVIGGIIEGYFTPLNINPYIKILFSLVTLGGLIVYFCKPFVRKIKTN